MINMKLFIIFYLIFSAIIGATYFGVKKRTSLFDTILGFIFGWLLFPIILGVALSIVVKTDFGEQLKD